MRPSHVKSKLGRSAVAVFEGLEDRLLFSNTLTVGAGKEFTTIQSAVNAASNGTTIKIFSGTYVEQVTVPSGLKNLTITSANGANVVVEAPPTLDASGAIIHVAGAKNTTIEGLTIEGPGGVTPGELDYGILVDGGGSADIESNTVTNIQDATFDSNNSGFGIAVTNGSATINDNVVASYQKAGILIGTPDNSTPTGTQTATVSNNTVTGVGATSVITQNGIEFVGPAASGTASGNTVSGDQYTPIGNAVGILAYDSGTVYVLNNICYSSDTNIVIDGGQDGSGNLLGGSNYAVVSGNETYNSTYYDGIDLVDGVTKVTVSGNYSFDNAVDGIFIDGTSVGNTISGNLVINNANYDIEDVTYSASNYSKAPVFGTLNFYSGNTFGTSNIPKLTSSIFWGFGCGGFGCFGYGYGYGNGCGGGGFGGHGFGGYGYGGFGYGYGNCGYFGGGGGCGGGGGFGFGGGFFNHGYQNSHRGGWFC